MKFREVQAEEQVIVTNITGKLNSSNLLTKELKDFGLYLQLYDSIMVSKAKFLKHHHTAPAHMMDGTVLPYYLPAAASAMAAMVLMDCSVLMGCSVA